ncbi:MAG: hypothetical protein IT449_05490 [Phycisphaerales bacterium]|nr:hypothetical protein [Phycisphaerales bacterium]
MKRDPIVEEVHRVREQMWSECGGSLSGLIDSLRASEAANPEGVISRDEFDRLISLPRALTDPVSRRP